MVATDIDLVARARAFAPKIEACRDESERERSLPASLMREMAEAGLFRVWVPKELGGFASDYQTNMRMIEEVAKIDGAAGWNVMIAATGAMFSAYMPPEGGREVFGDPVVITAGAVAPKGRAEPADGGYRLTGRWPLASGCLHSTWLGGGSFIFDGETPRVDANGFPDLRVFMMPKDECRIIDTWRSSGLRGTGSHDFEVADVFVPEQRAFSAVNGTSFYDAPLFRTPFLTIFPFPIAAMALGIARGALDAFYEMAEGKVPTMSLRKLRDRPAVQAQVAQAEALLRSARAFVFETADATWETVCAGDPVSEEQETVIHLAATHAGETCARAVDIVYTLGGATSVYETSRLQRCFRDVHVVTQHIGASFQWYEKTGSYFLGLGLQRFG